MSIGEPTNVSAIPSESNRRLVERLSGWRVYAFFASAAINISLLLVLAKWPWMLNESQTFFVTSVVAGSLMVFAVAVSGFRFLVSVKLFLGLAYSIACVWALASVNAAPVIQFNRIDVAILVLFPLLALLLTVGGVVVSRLSGYHRGKVFSIADGMLFITALAILLPILLRVIPQAEFVAAVSVDSVKAAAWFALTSCGWCIVVTNLFLRYLPESEHGKTHWQVALGWFLFSAMINWSHCRFGVVAAIWLWCSMLPIFGLIKSQAMKR